VTREPGAMLSRALDPRVESPADPISERILDAALELSAEAGIRALTMDDVATRAEVGRMTVYRRFGDRSHLIEALNVRETRRCLAVLDAATRADDPIEDQVAAGFVASIRLAREHPMLKRLSRDEPESVLRSLVADDSAMFVGARYFVAERLRASQRAGVLGPIEIDETAELLVRLGLSFALIQETVFPLEDDEYLGDLARRLIAPALRG
jgi:TetR/AcrR family transcriptional regulator, repressor for uid operon